MYQLLNTVTEPSQIKYFTKEQYELLASEIRQFLLESVSKTGGHLSSNLGIVELTIALHATFDSPQDKIIFDVGHQAYIHKILTGRKEKFCTLRKLNGLSGFLKRDESEHDCFEAGHSSTSISAGLGMAIARDIKGETFNVISVIGDGALTGGMALEALNHAGHENTNFLVVLNDNEMSIDTNVGGMSKHLTKLRTSANYYKAKDEIEDLLNKIPGVGKSFIRSIQKVKDSVKYFLVSGVLFEELGFTYIGPVNGHDVIELKEALNMAKKVNGAVLLHVLTKKGKGYEPAELSPNKFHGVSPFNINTGLNISSSKNASFSQVFGDTMIELAESDEDIVAITAAMPSGTGLSDFRSKFPDRFIDVGIAEQHAVTLAAGLASEGMKPVFAVYSTFLQRAYDQIIHDVCMQKLPVIFAIDRAGLVGQDGETHHGVFDLSYMQHIPNLVIMAPKDGQELRTMLHHAVQSKLPTAIRYPRGTAFVEKIDRTIHSSLNVHTNGNGSDIAIIAIGTRYYQALEIKSKLEKSDINCTIYQPRILKPFNTEEIDPILKKFNTIYVIEDNVRIGGFGSTILNRISELSLNDVSLFIKAYDDSFICHGEVEELLDYLNLDTESIITEIISNKKETI